MTQGTHLAVPVSSRDHRQGPVTAAVTLVQYGDYECPYTRLSTHVVRALHYIFHHQHTLEDADLAQFAEAVGLDLVIAAYVTSGQHSCPGVDHLLKGNQNDYSEHD